MRSKFSVAPPLSSSKNPLISSASARPQDYQASILRQHKHLDKVAKVKRPLAETALRIADKEHRLPTIVEAAAEAHSLVVGKGEVERREPGREISQQLLRHPSVVVHQLEVGRGINLVLVGSRRTSE